MSISLKTNADGSNGAVQLNGTDRIVMTSSGNVTFKNSGTTTFEGTINWPASGVSAGVWGSSTAMASFTVGSDGRITSASNALNIGTAANNLVKLDSSARLPAVNGTLLTNVIKPEDFTGTNVLLSAKGYQKLPSGLIIQWGTLPSTIQGQQGTATFPIAFPNSCLSAVATPGSSGHQNSYYNSLTFSNTQISVYVDGSTSTLGRYVAIGY